MIKALADNHSRAMPPAQTAEALRAGQAWDEIGHRRIDKVGYIRVPGFRGTQAADTARFAQQICGAITTLAPAATAGWVVDLRDNTGGNMWPMLRGLRPLLGERSPGAFRNREGKDSKWDVEAGEGCVASVPAEARVAVLIGPHTASAGEAVAVAFRGRPNARSFGLPTARLSTGNGSFRLPDGGMLLLTTAVSVDRAGNAYPAGLTPEVRVDAQSPGDGALTAALDWLASPPANARRH